MLIRDRHCWFFTWRNEERSRKKSREPNFYARTLVSIDRFFNIVPDRCSISPQHIRYPQTTLPHQQAGHARSHLMTKWTWWWVQIQRCPANLWEWWPKGSAFQYSSRPRWYARSRTSPRKQESGQRGADCCHHWGISFCIWGILREELVWGEYIEKRLIGVKTLGRKRGICWFWFIGGWGWCCTWKNYVVRSSGFLLNTSDDDDMKFMNSKPVDTAVWSLVNGYWCPFFLFFFFLFFLSGFYLDIGNCEEKESWNMFLSWVFTGNLKILLNNSFKAKLL